MTKDFILTLYTLPQSVFTFKEISFLFPEIAYNDLKSKVRYFVTVGKLKNIRKGIYTKENYNPLELANKIYLPSYISFETVLVKEGIVFQVYETIFMASYLSRKISVDDHKIFYRKMAQGALLNKSGIREESGYFIASKERAFLDAVFLYKNYFFDNLRPLDWEKVFNLQTIYNSQALTKRVNQYYKQFKEEDAK